MVSQERPNYFNNGLFFFYKNTLKYNFLVHFPNLFGKDNAMFLVKFTNQNLLTHAKFIKVHLPAEGKL